MLDVSGQNEPLIDRLTEKAAEVIRSGRYILGPEVTALEQEIADYIGVEHAIGVSSGTDALMVALMALGIGKGDEVITTPFTFFATGGCIARVGATPVFVDIRPDTFNIDVEQTAAAVTERTRAILPVHLYGQACDMEGLVEMARKHDLPIIEDAAQAIGTQSPLGPVGSLGAYGCFSFFPSKNLGGFGDAGLVTTQDSGLAEKARVMRAHGSKPKYYHAVVGGNFRIDALQAALAREASRAPRLDCGTSTERRALRRRVFRFGSGRKPLAHSAEAIRRSHLQPVRDPELEAGRATRTSSGAEDRDDDLLPRASSSTGMFCTAWIQRGLSPSFGARQSRSSSASDFCGPW